MDADHPSAHSRLQQEAERPLHPAGLPLRAVLLRYAGGEADLVMVARRQLSFLEEEFKFGRADGADELSIGTNFRLAWGLGDPVHAGRSGEAAVPLPERLEANSAMLFGAVALVLARYQVGEVADEAKTVDEFLAECQSLCGDALQVLSGVGVLVSETPRKRRYLPYLAPVLPALVHFVRRPGGAVAGVVRYDQGALDPLVAERFAGHIAEAARQLDQCADHLLDVDILTPSELKEVLELGGNPAIAGTAGNDERSLHGLFADVVREQPDAIAITAGDTSLSYAELNDRAELISSGMRALGVAAGDMVGVALEREADLVVALLGILKAGCAYVPMDPRYPHERLRYTTENAGLTLVVGGEGSFPNIEGVQVAGPDTLCALGVELNLPPQSETDSTAAYVIYTSGSTGRPKGVVVPHRNVVALIEATREDLRLCSDDVWTLFHSSAFDFSVWEIWGCLLTGGRLVVPDYWTTRDTSLFHELLVRERVSVLNQTPSAFAQVIEVDRRSPNDLAVRLVICGGEPLDVRMLAPWFARHSHTSCRIVNMFGITETTVHATAHTVTPADVLAAGRQVGRALPGWTLSIRDPRGRVLPVGVPGEICVGGAGVADCYLGQPELTAERFITDPHGGGRIYRSGDLGRLRPDGCLDHLGRMDSQVKVRGHRVELDEIRNVLLSHPKVTGAATLLNLDGNEDSATARIDAYITSSGSVAIADVLTYARTVLPAYMVPASVTCVPFIPLTINGKVDKSQLPPPGTVDGNETLTTASGVDEPDPLASNILGILRRALNVDVTVKDNFFELGGNSLLVIRVLRQMQEEGLPKVSTRDFYRNSTVGHLVELVRTLQPSARPM
ncbi:non-ribosomal peptide synthetase [Streptomyces bikiniensis]|uniref:Non-ribosomal peptide synthetase n=1 Tax=Streptomyces bikiniensis TaxID=1896 RepID=A0ABW8D1D3_STRBI